MLREFPRVLMQRWGEAKCDIGAFLARKQLAGTKLSGGLLPGENFTQFLLAEVFRPEKRFGWGGNCTATPGHRRIGRSVVQTAKKRTDSEIRPTGGEKADGFGDPSHGRRRRQAGCCFYYFGARVQIMRRPWWTGGASTLETSANCKRISSITLRPSSTWANSRPR
jgi:hypothetical protein